MNSNGHAIRLEWLDPKELTPNIKNWRRHPETQRLALEGVIEEVGWAGAALYNELTGRLIDGHLRQDVALRRGDEKIPVLVGSWDEPTEAKILATLDPIAAMATADAAALDALLREVDTGSAAVMDMLRGLAEDAGLYELESEPAHTMGTSVGGRYDFREIDTLKLAYRIEAAWRAGDGLALDLFSGEGQLAWWYGRRFKRVIRNDKKEYDGIEIVGTVNQFLAKNFSQYAASFDFVDFDDEGSPLREIALFFENLPQEREKPFVLCLTDGSGLNLKLRGKMDVGLYRLEGGTRQATDKDYLGFEELVTNAVNEIATGAGWQAHRLSSVRANENNVLYQTYSVTR